jgi:DNA-binding transcriptional LysR family regulator
MSGVDVRELRYFVAVAEELSFTRAAERLGIAQPPLSKAIARLESRLGVRLLDRTTRQVSLTPAGEVLLVEGRLAIETVEAAARRAQRAGADTPHLAVTVKPGGDPELIRAILAEYAGPDRPEARVEVCRWGEPTERIRDGRADVALVRSPCDVSGLDSEVLYTEPRAVVLPEGHRLAGRRRLRRADLAGERVPRWPGRDPAGSAYWAGRDPASTRAAWAADGDPDAGPEPTGPVVSDLSQLIEVVTLGQAIALLPESLAARHLTAGLVSVPVTDVSPSVVSVAWPPTSRSLAVAAFVRAAVEVTGSRRRDPSPTPGTTVPASR